MLCDALHARAVAHTCSSRAVLPYGRAFYTSARTRFRTPNFKTPTAHRAAQTCHESHASILSSARRRRSCDRNPQPEGSSSDLEQSLKCMAALPLSRRRAGNRYIFIRVPVSSQISPSQERGFYPYPSPCVD